MTRPLAAAVAAGSLLFLGACLLPATGLRDRQQVGDTPLYERYASRMLDGEIPYRDFYVEYPPGALPAFLAAEPGGNGYATRFKLLMVALGLVTILLVGITLQQVGVGPGRLVAATALVGLAPAALGPVFLVNFDPWPAMLASAAIALLVAGRDRLGLGVLAAAVAAKAYPVVLLPLALLYVRARLGARPALIAGGIFLAVLGAVALPFFLLAPGGFGYSLSVAFRRPLQIESLGSSFLLAAHSLGLYEPQVRSGYGSQNLDGLLPGALAVASALGAVTALLAVWLTYARVPTRERLPLAAAAAVTGFVAFGKTLSPQYLVWLVPLAALVPRRFLLSGALLAAALVLTHAWFPSRYGDVVALEPVGWLVLARNFVLVGLFGVLFWHLRSSTK